MKDLTFEDFGKYLNDPISRQIQIYELETSQTNKLGYTLMSPFGLMTGLSDVVKFLKGSYRVTKKDFEDSFVLTHQTDQRIDGCTAIIPVQIKRNMVIYLMYFECNQDH